MINKFQIKIDYILSSDGVDIISFLADSKIFPSRGEARKMIQNGGVSINRKKVSDIAFTISADSLLHNKYILVQKGRKNYFLVEAVWKRFIVYRV